MAWWGGRDDVSTRETRQDVITASSSHLLRRGQPREARVERASERRQRTLLHGPPRSEGCVRMPGESVNCRRQCIPAAAPGDKREVARGGERWRGMNCRTFAARPIAALSSRAVAAAAPAISAAATTAALVTRYSDNPMREWCAS